jgi:hypothetical protein
LEWIRSPKPVCSRIEVSITMGISAKRESFIRIVGTAYSVLSYLKDRLCDLYKTRIIIYNQYMYRIHFFRT